MLVRVMTRILNVLYQRQNIEHFISMLTTQSISRYMYNNRTRVYLYARTVFVYKCVRVKST